MSKTDVKIPIKDLLRELQERNGSSYDWDNELLLRRYYIACLNMGYIDPEELAVAVNKFVKKIKTFEVDAFKNEPSPIYGIECYKATRETLLLHKALIDLDEDKELYDKTVFKAVSEIMLGGVNKDYPCLSYVFGEMLAEKIYCMDVSEKRIIMPKTEQLYIGEDMVEVRCGYERYQLAINLLKEFFIAYRLNENIILSKAIKSDPSDWLSVLTDTEEKESLLKTLEVISQLENYRLITGRTHPKELSLIEKYQLKLNALFKKPDQNYFAFCALITNDELREKCMCDICDED